MKRISGEYLASLINYPQQETFSRIDIDHITIDSRKVDSSSLFVALKGECLDGHDFIQDAINMGSPLILASISEKAKVLRALAHTQTQVMLVDCPLTSLQLMAKRHIEKATSLHKIGITGSVGKTTTKEILSSILEIDARIAKTIGNFNSEIGLAISAFEVEENSEFAIFEMGVDKIGEMETMVDIFTPHTAIITNIGLSHIGKMGSMENIATQKGKIFHSSINSAFMNEVSKWKNYITKDKHLPLTTFGLKSMPYITHITSLNLHGWKFFYRGIEVHLKGIGKHTLIDALGAIKIAESLGINSFSIAEGLHQYRGLKGRSQVTSGRVTIIEDWYNSSVDSTSQILQCMKMAPCEGDKRVVLGSMKEMGSYTKRAHEMVAKDIELSQMEHVYLYGEEMYTTYKALKKNRSEKSIFYTDEYQHLEQAMLRDTKIGDLVLLKGSRAMQMERLVPFMRSIR